MPTTKKGQRNPLSQRAQRANKRRKEIDSTDAPPQEEEEVLIAASSSDEVMPGILEDETVVGGSGGRMPEISTTRCTLKLKVTGGKNAFGRAMGSMKEFFTQLKTFDKWAFIAPWYNNTTSGISNIESTKDWSIDAKSVTSYFPRFMNRKDQKNIKFDEYISINIGHSVDLSELILDLGTWLQQGEHTLYVDMLQAERKRETGFLTNSYFTMDLELLKETMEEDIGCKVGLRWKPIAGTFNKDGVPVRAIHIEVDSSYYHQALRKLSNVYGKGVSGFRDGRKMRFFASLRNAKSAETKASVKKAIERQRFFNDVVKRDYLSDILHLDVIPSGSNLPTMREMINRIRSIQFPHLRMIHSIDETWGKVLYKGDFTYLVMPHIEEEAYLMMSNLLPFLRYE